MQGYNSLRKTVIHRKKVSTPGRQGVVRSCRHCSTELQLGENWTESRKNKGDYICRSCRSLLKQ
jgi:predicted SprT family Zn-dependent metalloprotease